MQMVRSQGSCLHGKADGRNDAPTILLLNSLGTDLRMWDGIASHLADDFHVIRFDKPGHGLSETAPRPHTMQQLAGHALAVLDAFDVERAHVVGLSIGGQIALTPADAYPDQIDRLMLSNTAARIGTTEMWSERIAALEQGGIPLRADGVLLHWFSARWRAEHPDELAGWRRMLSRCDLQGYIGGCEALARTDLTAVCDALRRPVLAIAGSEDGATPPTIARATAARIAESEFACIEGARACPD